MNISRIRLQAAVVIPTVVAGLVLTSAPGLALEAASPSVAPAAAAAPNPAAAANGFALFIRATEQPAPCVTGNFDATGDAFISRNSCAYTDFTATGVTGALTSELYAEGATTPFATPAVSTTDAATGARRILLEPKTTAGNDWSAAAGRVRLVIKDTGVAIGEYQFNFNTLVGTVDGGPPTTPGAAFDVPVTISEHVGGGGTTARTTPVPATFKLRVTAPNGSTLWTSPEQTADASGTKTVNVPAGIASSVQPDASTDYQAALGLSVVDASYSDSQTGTWKASTAGAGSHVVEVIPTTLDIDNSFVSSVGWVKPGETYPSRLTVTNPTATDVTPTIDMTAPTGTSFQSAAGPSAPTIAAGASTFTWAPGSIGAGETRSLVIQSKSKTADELDTIVWRDLSSTAVLEVSGQSDQTSVSHGPKVIPPSDTFDTARYGDRPFPIVPVQYTDRAYQDTHSGDSLESVINSPSNEGSTFNLFQEMSLGQLFPNGTVPSAGIGSKDFTYAPGFDFSNRAVPGNTCKGSTLEDAPVAAEGTPLYPARITDGVYNLPGQTEYYGSDSNGSAVVGSAGGVGALQAIDSGCGDTGKLVYDAAAIADPEVDYSDFDTDKDGVVDFFMVVFAGCGGNGASQLSVAGCEYPDAPYDNVWPHSSSLENGYADPVTKLPGYTTDDQLKNLNGEPLWYQSNAYDPKNTTTADMGDALKVLVRVGPYNVNPETAIDFASVISHEYGHSLGLPDFYSTGNRETYGDWNLMATDKSHNIDAFGRQELGWVVPTVLDSSRTVMNFKDSKEDIGTITWKRPDGTPYTLTDGADGTVHNSEMYVAKLPGRTLLDESAFGTTEGGVGATPSHLWWSGSGNDFGCAPGSGRNFDLSIPQLAGLTDPNATATLKFKSRWDIEWDYDYGYVLTTVNGGQSYTSNASENGYSSNNTDPTEANPNSVACQTLYDNGLTGTSGSYEDGTQAVDRKAGNTPAAVFLEDEYDISELTGEANGALRFSYSTDPGLARPGWFIDDAVVTVDPDGAAGPTAPYDVLATDFETSGGPDDSRVFNGGCREGLTTAQSCTLGWKFLQAGAESVQDHAYYLEMRDRSGFDLDGNGEADRGAPQFQPGLYLSYTDEAHGYGNVGTDDPPAQSPLDSVPEPGSEAPNLNDAAFNATATRSAFSDSSAAPHIDNYTDPSSESGMWEFGYDCLRFKVDSMAGETDGPGPGVDPNEANGDLTGNVTFTMGAQCGAFDYGYVAGGGGSPTNTAPTAAASATPSTVQAGSPTTLSAAASADAETPDELDHSWNFGNGGATKDADGKVVKATYNTPGTYTAKVTVTDPQGLSATASTTVTVVAAPVGGGGGTTTPPKARIKLKSKKPDLSQKVRLSARKSTGAGPLTYAWNLHNGGKKVDATGKRVKIVFKRPGRKKVTLFVTDINGQRDKVTRKFRVRAVPAFTRAATTTYDVDDLTRLFWPW